MNGPGRSVPEITALFKAYCDNCMIYYAQHVEILDRPIQRTVMACPKCTKSNTAYRVNNKSWLE